MNKAIELKINLIKEMFPNLIYKTEFNMGSTYFYFYINEFSYDIIFTYFNQIYCGYDDYHENMDFYKIIDLIQKEINRKK